MGYVIPFDGYDALLAEDGEQVRISIRVQGNVVDSLAAPDMETAERIADEYIPTGAAAERIRVEQARIESREMRDELLTSIRKGMKK